jgi:nicotinate-nucleotide adenylyltransferase
MLRRLAILGGSFNPIHVGHLVVAERAVEALRLDRLLLVPSADTPLKNPATLAPARHRLAMARLAARGLDRVAVSDLEVRRGGTSFTADTVDALDAREIFVVVGADAQLLKWRRIRDLAARVTFAVAARPGCQWPRLPRYIHVIPVAAPLLDISATDLRERLRDGRSVRFLVPAPVERYIRRHGLYHRRLD